MKEGTTEANQYQQAEDGKTELSLMHFTVSFCQVISQSGQDEREFMIVNLHRKIAHRKVFCLGSNLLYVKVCT